MADENTPSLLDTVSAAIAEATPSTQTENNNGDSTTADESAADTGADTETTAGADGAGDSVDAGDRESGDLAGGDGTTTAGAEADGEGEVDETDPEAVKAAEAAGRTRDPVTGKFTKAEKKEPSAEEKAAAEAKKTADAEAAKLAGKKAPDAINDPIPKDLKQVTAERIRTLIDVAKKADEKVVAATEERNFLLNRIMQSTASPEQYNEALEAVRLVNSTDPADARKLVEYLRATLTEVSRRAGIVIPGVDVLSQHADLKQKVELGQISRKDAEEMAAMRNANAHTTQTREAAAAKEREQQAFNGHKAAAISSLNTLETQLRGVDKNFDAKKAVLVPSLKPIFAQLHPSRWSAAFKQAYDALPAAAYTPRPAPVRTTAASGSTQPLRVRQQAGGQAKQPSSLLEAVSAGIAQAGGR